MFNVKETMMALSYRTLPADVYAAEVKKKMVNHEASIGYVYLDNAGIATVATGRAIVVKGIDPNTGKRGVWVIDPEAEKELKQVTGKGFTDDQRKTLQASADTLNSKGAGRAALAENVPLFYKDGTATDGLEKSRQTRTQKPALSTFGLTLTDPQLKKHEEIVISKKEAEFNAALKRKGIDLPPPSKERQALLSIYYNQPSVFSNPQVIEALKSGDRAAIIAAIEAVPADPIVKKRRQQDLNDFGRPDNPEVIQNENDSQRNLDDVFKQGQNAGTEHTRTGFYIWRTSKDDKVRLDHALREGKIFSWSVPPSGGHPGEGYGCRCRAETIPE